MRIELRRLSPDDGRDVYDMLQAIPAEENGFTNEVSAMTYGEYRQWLLKMDSERRRTGLMDGWRVPATAYWLYADGVPVGIGKLRHFLTDSLLERGGHIGYAVAPRYRGRGYGNELLRLLLIEANKMGIDRALLTVDPRNLPSRAVALYNGGVIEERRPGNRLHIWVETGP